MRKSLTFVLLMVIAISVVFSACSGSTLFETTTTTTTSTERQKEKIQLNDENIEQYLNVQGYFSNVTYSGHNYFGDSVYIGDLEFQTNGVSSDYTFENVSLSLKCFIGNGASTNTYVTININSDGTCNYKTSQTIEGIGITRYNVQILEINVRSGYVYA